MMEVDKMTGNEAVTTTCTGGGGDEETFEYNMQPGELIKESLILKLRCCFNIKLLKAA